MGFLKARATAFAMVLGLGFILLVSLVVNALAVGLSNELGRLLSGVNMVTLAILSSVLSLVLTAGVFALIFKYLADVHIHWQEVL